MANWFNSNLIMKNVEIYDQYLNVYLDKQTDSLTLLNLNYNEELDNSRYTLVYPSSGFTSIKAENLHTEDAINLVKSLYLESKNLGESYEDFSINLDKGYAEILIKFSDGEHLNRVIYIKDNL